MIREFRCDFHVHTCLSPCADLDMYPGQSSPCRLRAVSTSSPSATITRPKTSRNVIQSAKGTGLTVFPAMEIMSSEEVHVLALFDRQENLAMLQDIVYRHLPGKTTRSASAAGHRQRPRRGGGLSDGLLIGATVLRSSGSWTKSTASAARRCGPHRPGKLRSARAARIRPEAPPLDALEVSRRTGLAEARRRYPGLARFPMIESSDSHIITDIGKGITRVLLEEPRRRS